MSQLLAHQIQIDRGVGATKHIEPNDTPRSGELTRVWFALTRKGGQVIPLENCDCTLAVYAQPRSADATPIATPPLEPYSAEGYTDIPATELTFPQVGAYELVLVGAPKAGLAEPQSFDSFQLSFKVTVAQGTTVAPSPVAVINPETGANGTIPSPAAGTTANSAASSAATPESASQPLIEAGAENTERVITDVVVEPVVAVPEDVTVPVGIGAIGVLALGVVFYGWRSGWGAKKDSK